MAWTSTVATVGLILLGGNRESDAVDSMIQYAEKASADVFNFSEVSVQ